MVRRRKARVKTVHWDIIDKLQHPGVTGPVRVEPVDIDLLHVDRRYQREENAHWARRTSKVYSSLANAGIVVAERPNGNLYIIDGQQRAAAAKEAGAKNIMCFITPVDGKLKTESDLFILLNEVRTSVTPYENYKAALVSGVKDAVAVKRALAKFDYEVARTSGRLHTVMCVQRLRHWARIDEGILQRTVEICAMLYDGEKFDNRTVHALASTLHHLRKIGWKNPELTSGDLRKLQKAGPEGIDDKIKSAERFHGKSGNNVGSVQGNGIIQLLNSGRRDSNRIPLMPI